MTARIVLHNRIPRTPILEGCAKPLLCPACYNDDPNKFWTVTDGTVLKGFVCQDCEEKT